MKQWYTAKEIADALGLVNSTIARRAERQGWESQQRLGKGGGCEYHISNLSQAERKALEAQQINDLIPSVHISQNVAVKPSSAQLGLTERQSATADARGTVINAIKAMASHGVTQEAAITTLLAQATIGELTATNPVLDRALQLAKDPRGNSASNYPSARSIKRWLAKEPTKLAPESKREVKIPEWAKTFLGCYQRPQKPSVAEAYDDFLDIWDGDKTPSIHAVRRFLKKVGNVSLQHGRMGSREIKNIKGHVRRSVKELVPGDIYSPDGHTFDAEVAHPLHGRPFKPEITSFIDIATRKLVGYSVDLAESGIAVLDALIDSCKCSIPVVIYSDNGSGYRNALLKDNALGVLSRLGSEITHSLPYNSQARGATERAHKSIWIKAARKLDSYLGADMDREAAQLNHKLSRKAIRDGGKTHVMAWDDFLEFCEKAAARYNDAPHSFLPKITDEDSRRRHRSPNEHWATFEEKGWKADTLSPDELSRIFRPRMERTVNRCQVQIFNNIYFSNVLEEFHGDKVQVGFDIHDPHFVWVYELESGVEICKAEWNANEVNYMPTSFMDNAREKRTTARLKRNDIKRQEIEAERFGSYALEQPDGDMIELASTRRISEKLKQQNLIEAEYEEINEPVTESQEEQAIGLKMPDQMTFEERMKTYQSYESGEIEIPAEHEFWFKSFPKSKAYKSAVAREKDDLPSWG